MKIGVALSKPIELLRKLISNKWRPTPPPPPPPPSASSNTENAKVPVTRTWTTRCDICMENINVDEMFSIPECGHSYCLSCMSKHVEYMLREARLPICPHDKCWSQLEVESCEKFLSSDSVEVMRQRLIEAKIPASDRIYCPNPKCCALFSKTQFRVKLMVHLLPRARYRCPKCKLFFCIDCKASWHRGLRCREYRRRNVEYSMIKSLASKNSWRQCPNCNHMVSLHSGCYYIQCRCGHKFCYACGAAWEGKKICKC